MRRHDFAPAVVPQDAQSFFDPNGKNYDKDLFSGFYAFYTRYGVTTPENDIKREVDGQMHSFPAVVSTTMSRSRDRSAYILRATADDDGERLFRLFKRDYYSGEVTEFEIVKYDFARETGRLNHQPSYTTLYLAQAGGHLGVLELGPTEYVWAFDGHEDLLEPVPPLKTPQSTTKPELLPIQKPLRLPMTVLPPPLV